MLGVGRNQRVQAGSAIRHGETDALDWNEDIVQD
jgi:hypothetical protein